jgi:hypothetical protein
MSHYLRLHAQVPPCYQRPTQQIYLLLILKDKVLLATEAEQTHLISKQGGYMHIIFT